MKTKAEIVQSLLNEGKISAEDAVILLQNTTIIINQRLSELQKLQKLWNDSITETKYKVTCGSATDVKFNIN